MFGIKLCGWVTAMSIIGGSVAIAAEPPAAPTVRPSEKASRAAVNALIKRFESEKKPATLGLIEEAIDQSIAYGAPTYNAGDVAGCFRFYSKTAEALVAAFPDDASATEPARKAIADLRNAIERAGKTKSVDRGAWAMRLAFDKTALAVALTTQSADSLVRMGHEYFRRSEFEESQDAFEAAIASLAELEGRAPDQIPPSVRFAPPVWDMPCSRRKSSPKPRRPC